MGLNTERLESQHHSQGVRDYSLGRREKEAELLNSLYSRWLMPLSGHLWRFPHAAALAKPLKISNAAVAESALIGTSTLMCLFARHGPSR